AYCYVLVACVVAVASHLRFCFSGPGDHRDLHSFPTRRSSDLGGGGSGAGSAAAGSPARARPGGRCCRGKSRTRRSGTPPTGRPRSEEHTSELQSRENLVCRLLLEKKKKKEYDYFIHILLISNP